MTTLIIDAANVVGSRPDGWWKDRAGAARRLHEQLLVADLPYDDVVLVLEGQAKGGGEGGRRRPRPHRPRRGRGRPHSGRRGAGRRGAGRPGRGRYRGPDAAG